MTSARGCARHRIALVAFVDRREVDERTGDALRHLEACPDCERELGSIALAIAGLRRIEAETRRAEPADDGWVRLHRRLGTPAAPAWRWRSSMVGLLAGAWLIGALVAPTAFLPSTMPVFQEIGIDQAALLAVGADAERAELGLLSQRRLERAAVQAVEDDRDTTHGPPGWARPDGLATAGTARPDEPPAVRLD